MARVNCLQHICKVAFSLCLGIIGWAHAAPTCDKPLYLTFDTGHMGVARLIAEVLQRAPVDRHPIAERERLYFEAMLRVLDRLNPGYAD